MIKITDDWHVHSNINDIVHTPCENKHFKGFLWMSNLWVGYRCGDCKLPIPDDVYKKVKFICGG